ncbi:MAG: endonuclease MutS2 [Candidatus Kapabacteria bacterium]|nr:endonuclease MutS2 [Candidatus Kapabacteria bacterium]
MANNKYMISEETLINQSLEQLEFAQVLEFLSKYTVSAPGKELILSAKPDENLPKLREEHLKIEEMNKLATEDDRFPLENYSDIRGTLKKTLVQGVILSTEEILKIAKGIRAGRLIQNYFVTRDELYPKLAEQASLLHSNRSLEKHIYEAIDESTAEVLTSATPELARIRKSINDKSNRLRSRLQKIMKNVSADDMLQDDFITLREERLVLPVKVENKRMIPGIIHGVSHTGATVFLEPSETIEMNNELSLLKNEEIREIYRILGNLSSEIGDEAHEFLRTVELTAHFDAIHAKSSYALEFGGIMPILSDDTEISLNKIRHPLLVHAKSIKQVQPLTIRFSGEKRGHLISGPNAGGKTVALKSVGLNITMALSGIFPLGMCQTSYRSIFTAIGDHQSIEEDLSTFSSQIAKLKDIIDFSDPRAMVLIDEIGTGTDPQEGSALSAGILDTLIELKSFFVVTTHKSSLKSYALSRDVIENASLEFDDRNLKPTYNFLQGIPGNSYAFILAKNIGLQSTVLERSKKYLGSRQSELEESIAVLQKYKSEAEHLRNELAQEKLKAAEVRKDYEARLKDFKEKRKKKMDEAVQEAHGIVSSANAMVENTIRQIKEDKRDAAEVKKDFHKEKDRLEKQITKIDRKAKPRKQESDFKVGDVVTLEDVTSVGTILNIDSGGKSALVEFNGMKFRMKFSQLFKTEKKVKKTPVRDEVFVKMDVVTSIDVRGKRAFEAVSLIDEHISNAIVSSLGIVTIIHGKGTGALRQATHEFLDTHHSVKSYRPGKIVEGGDGITVVELM